MRLPVVMLLMQIASPCFAGVTPDDEGTRIGVVLVEDGWPVPDPDEDTADVLTRQRLSRPIELGPEPMQFEDIMDVFRAQTGVDFVVNWQAAEIGGAERGMEIEVILDDVSALTALDLVLACASGAAFEGEKLGYDLRDGVVFISTLEELKLETHSRIYNVTPLFVEPTRPVGLIYEEDAFNDTIAFHAWRRGQRAYPFTDPMQVAVYQQQIMQMQDELDDLLKLTGQRDDGWTGVRGGGGGGGGLFADDRVEPEFGESYYERMETLTELIQASVGDLDEWLDEDSSILEVDGRFVITTTHANHRAIEALLNSLLDSEVDDQADIIRDAQVMQLLHRASEVQLDGGFEDALLLADRALLIDPDHVTARAMHRVLSETVERMRERDAAGE